MIVLAFWQYQKQNDKNLMIPEILFTIAGILTMLSGLAFIDTSPGGGVMICAFAVFLFIIAIVGVLQAGGPSRGLSQFKIIINRMRGKHGNEE